MVMVITWLKFRKPWDTQHESCQHLSYSVMGNFGTWDETSRIFLIYNRVASLPVEAKSQHLLWVELTVVGAHTWPTISSPFR